MNPPKKSKKKVGRKEEEKNQVYLKFSSLNIEIYTIFGSENCVVT
jgi:hypothetical protein